jgi:hypothetical protein
LFLSDCLISPGNAYSPRNGDAGSFVGALNHWLGLLAIGPANFAGSDVRFAKSKESV